VNTNETANHKQESFCSFLNGQPEHSGGGDARVTNQASLSRGRAHDSCARSNEVASDSWTDDDEATNKQDDDRRQIVRASGHQVAHVVCASVLEAHRVQPGGHAAFDVARVDADDEVAEEVLTFGVFLRVLHHLKRMGDKLLDEWNK